MNMGVEVLGFDDLGKIVVQFRSLGVPNAETL